MPPTHARLYWEDFAVGRSVDFGETLVTADEVIAFALEFDPDASHLGKAPDDAEITASDWHSCAILMRMMCDDYLGTAAGAGAPGVEHVRWLGVVRPGDVLRARRTPVEKRASKSRPHIGIVRMYQQVFNQRSETVMTWLPIQLYERRNPSAEPPPPASIPDPESLKQHSQRMPPPPNDSSRAPVGTFDDVVIGEDVSLGSHTFLKDEMLSFARRFNPQYFHANEEAAKDSIYGGLIASGWHTGAIWNRHLVTRRLERTADLQSDSRRRPADVSPSIAVVDMKWPAPVRPGDEITFRSRITGKSASSDFPQWGLVESFEQGFNQDGKTVFSLIHHYWVERA